MRQTIALLVDGYRELNAKRLFWLVLVVSGLVVAAFGAVGLTEKGLSIFVWEIEAPINAGVFKEDVFYKIMFVNLGIGFWLTWGAAILALVSTASIIPDFISGGSIDLMLSKNIGRTRLFLTKYVTGLLFVGLQVLVFCIASFLVIGLRAGVWEIGIFIAVPLVILFFSYLFSICALFGLLTKSTIASLLLTLGVWFAIFGVNATDGVLLSLREVAEQRIEDREKRIDALEERIERMENPQGVVETFQAAYSLEDAKQRLTDLSERQEGDRESLATISRFYDMTFAVKTVLPKTGETVGLTERWLIDLADMPQGPNQEQPQPALNLDEELPEDPSGRQYQQDPRVSRAIQRELRDRSVWWVIGTSVLFEGVVLALSCWIFARRDF